MFSSALHKRRIALGSALLLAILSSPSVWNAVIPAARAEVATAKGIVDAAKAQGVVGEQADGYLGLVSGSASSAISAAVAEINAGRAAVYKDTAAKTGVSPAAAGEAAAKQILERMPSGLYYRPAGGSWTKK